MIVLPSIKDKSFVRFDHARDFLRNAFLIKKLIDLEDSFATARSPAYTYMATFPSSSTLLTLELSYKQTAKHTIVC